MLNPLTSVLTVAWLVLDLVFVLQSRRGWIPTPFVVVSQLAVAGLAATLLSTDEARAAMALWAMLATVNACLATLGLRNQRTFAVVGFAATAAALVLIAARSFASLPVMVIAAVFCLASALFPASRATSSSRPGD